MNSEVYEFKAENGRDCIYIGNIRLLEIPFQGEKLWHLFIDDVSHGLFHHISEALQLVSIYQLKKTDIQDAKYCSNIKTELITKHHPDCKNHEWRFIDTVYMKNRETEETNTVLAHSCITYCGGNQCGAVIWTYLPKNKGERK